MKQKKEKKLGLGKMTIKDLDPVPGKIDRQGVQGAFKHTRVGITQVPVFC